MHSFFALQSGDNEYGAGNLPVAEDLRGAFNMQEWEAATTSISLFAFLCLQTWQATCNNA